MKTHKIFIATFIFITAIAMSGCYTNYIDEPQPSDSDKELSEQDVLEAIGADFDPQNEHINYSLAPNAHQIDEGSITGIITDEYILPGVDQITIDIPLFNKLGKLNVGDILVIMPSENVPFGLLARVEDIEQRGENYVLELSEAEYDDAFETIDVELIVTADEAATLDGLAYTDNSNLNSEDELSRANDKTKYKVPKIGLDIHDINNGVVKLDVEFKKKTKESTPWLFNGKGSLEYQDKGSRIVISKKANGTTRYDVTLAGRMDLKGSITAGIGTDNIKVDKDKVFECETPIFEKSTPKGKFPIYAGIGIYFTGAFSGEVSTSFKLGALVYFSQSFTFEDGTWENPSTSMMTLPEESSSKGAINGFQPWFKWEKLNIKGSVAFGIKSAAFGQWCKKITPKNRKEYYRRQKDGIAGAIESSVTYGFELDVDILDKDAFKESPRCREIAEAETKIVSRCDDKKHPILSQLGSTLVYTKFIDNPSYPVFPTYESYSSKFNDDKTIAEFTWYSYDPYFLDAIVSDEKIELLEGSGDKVVKSIEPTYLGQGYMPGDNSYKAKKKTVTISGLDPDKEYFIRPVISYLFKQFYGAKIPLTGQQEHKVAAIGNAIAIGYNEAGLPKKIIENQMERTTYYTYNQKGKIETINLKYWDEEYPVNLYDFSFLGNSKSITYCKSTEMGEAGYTVVKAKYDNSNRIQSFHDGVDMTQLFYWENGNIVKIETFDDNKLQTSVSLIYDNKNEHINHHMQWTYVLSNELAPFTLAGLLGPTSMNLPIKAIITDEGETQTVNISYDIDKETNYILEERFTMDGITMRLPYAYRDMIVQSRSADSNLFNFYKPQLFKNRHKHK